jgi:hypothetical protein
VPFRLRPRDTRLEPDLTRLCDGVVGGARLLSELLGADPADLSELALHAAELDAETEEAAHAVLRELASALVTPIDRADVFRLAWSVRACSRSIFDATEMVSLLGILRPPESIVEQLQYIQLAADVVAHAVPKFSRQRALTEAWIELSRLRKQSSARHRITVAEITAPQSGLSGANDVMTALRLLQVELELQTIMKSFDLVGVVFQQIVVQEG